MNQIQVIQRSRVRYKGTQNSVLKYMSMRKRMGKPVVTIEEIIAFFPHKIKRKDNLLGTLKSMVKNEFIKEKDKGYVITHIGKQVPFIVANMRKEKLIRKGKRVLFTDDEGDF